MNEKEIEDFLKELDTMLPVLSKTLRQLEQLNESSGATKRANDMREEIARKGWDIVSKLYDPLNNTNDPGAIPLFEMYKFIYQDMKNKGEI